MEWLSGGLSSEDIKTSLTCQNRCHLLRQDLHHCRSPIVKLSITEKEHKKFDLSRIRLAIGAPIFALIGGAQVASNLKSLASFALLGGALVRHGQA